MSGAPPVITIDGPAASGKGSVAVAVAAALRFHCLDSGKLYRAVALAARQRGLTADDAPAIAALAAALADDKAALRRLMRSPALPADDTAKMASAIAAHAAARRALIGLQRAALRPPGLVADGRDMGTVVFPDAVVKTYLTAAATTRAKRRARQLRENGMHATMASVLEELRRRDARDSARAESPLRPPAGALRLSSTSSTVDDIARIVLKKFRDAVFYPQPPATEQSHLA